MPEGPEVTIIAQYLDSTIKNMELIEINIISGRYTHENLSGLSDLKLQLEQHIPLKIMSVNSKGKFLWFVLKFSITGKNVFIMNTFGLTGEWSFKQSSQNRISMKLRDNTGVQNYVYYNDSRNFGTIQITCDVKILDKKINKLAPDILKTQMSDDDLVLMIKKYADLNKKKNLNIVDVLMNSQSAIVSGIGNYLIAEILYDANVSPFRCIPDLSLSEIKKIAHSMRKISKISYCDNTTGYMKKFETFMKTHKTKILDGTFPNYHPDISTSTKFKFQVYKQKKDPLGYDIKQDQVIKGRTIYWVPDVQV